MKPIMRSRLEAVGLWAFIFFIFLCPLWFVICVFSGQFRLLIIGILLLIPICIILSAIFYFVGLAKTIRKNKNKYKRYEQIISEKGACPEAADELEKMLDLAESRSEKNDIILTLSALYLTIGMKEKASQTADRLDESAFPSPDIGTSSRVCLAEIYTQLYFIRCAAEETEKAEAAYHAGEPYFLEFAEQIPRCAIAIAKHEEAHTDISRAMEILSSAEKNADKLSLIQIWDQKARICEKMSDNAKALEYYQMVYDNTDIKMVRESAEKNIERLKNTENKGETYNHENN